MTTDLLPDLLPGLLPGLLTAVAAMFLLGAIEPLHYLIARHELRVLAAREHDLQDRIATATALNQRLKGGDR